MNFQAQNAAYMSNNSLTHKNSSNNSLFYKQTNLLRQQQQLLNNCGSTTSLATATSGYKNLYSTINNNSLYLPRTDILLIENNAQAIQSPNSSSGVSSGNVSPDNLLNNGFSIANTLPLHSLLQTPEGIKNFNTSHLKNIKDVNTRDFNFATPLLAMLRYAGNESGFKYLLDGHLIEAIRTLEQFKVDMNAQDKGI